jgi:hypothetical protein
MHRADHRTPVANHRSEVELLLCCARACMDAEKAERIKILVREELDWSSLLRIADLHGVLPLLYRSLHTTCPDAVPTAVLARLRTHFDATARHNMLLTEALLPLLGLLEEHGIRALPYKGPVLAAVIYGHLALRQCGDLDILVRERDVEAAKALLLTQGYQSPLTATQEVSYRQHKYAMPLVHSDRQVTIDLHWRLTRPAFSSPLELTHLWDCLQPLSLLGTTVWSLPPEELLLLLVVHGTKHGWSRLGWLCDVAELLRAFPEFAWQRVVDQACGRGGARMLWLSLHLAHQTLGATLPEDCLRRIQADPIVPTLAAQVRARLFTAPAGGHDVLAGLAFSLRVHERVRDRVPILRYGLGVLRQAVLAPSAAHHRAVRAQPPWRAWLPTLRRFLRLVRVYGLRPVLAMLRHLLGT